MKSFNVHVWTVAVGEDSGVNLIHNRKVRLRLIGNNALCYMKQIIRIRILNRHICSFKG